LLVKRIHEFDAIGVIERDAFVIMIENALMLRIARWKRYYLGSVHNLLRGFVRWHGNPVDEQADGMD
jgi:hypothetical protein